MKRTASACRRFESFTLFDTVLAQEVRAADNPFKVVENFMGLTLPSRVLNETVTFIDA
jgi:hypothetical protein